MRLPAPLLALTTRQLATLALSGMPLDQALAAVAEQADDARAAKIAGELRAQVAAGESLPAALARYPRAFSPLYRGLVGAGAETGRLAEVLARLADYLEAREALRQKVVLALIYPAIVTVIAFAVIAVLLAYVVPQVVSVYQQSRQTLPWLTQALIATSAFFRATGWLWLAGVAGALHRVLGRVAARRRSARAGTRSCCALPVVGRLLRSLDTARFASTLAILTGSGAPLLRSLDAAAEVVRHAAAARRAAATRGSAGARRRRAVARAARADRCFRPCSSTSSPTASRAGSWRRCSSARRRSSSATRSAASRGSPRCCSRRSSSIMGAIVLVLVLAVMLPIVSMNQLIR